MSAYFDNYDTKFPELILDILDYFSNRPHKDERISKVGPVYDFAEYYNKCHPDSIEKVNPIIVWRICNKLCDLGRMTRIRRPCALEQVDDFMFFKQEPNEWNNPDVRILLLLTHFYNSIVYGFDYIYRIYKNAVFPIIYEKENGDLTIGTGFEFYGGIATAKHCLEGAKSISIKGYTKEELSSKPIYVHNNDNIDIAFIDVGKTSEFLAHTESAEIMQEVLTMGYPKIPQFTDFLTAEKASISSKAEGRITASKGNVSAVADNYVSKIELILITAKIRGGNSGGPVINSNGSIVGIAYGNPIYDETCGDYDDLGYGIVVPIKYLNEVHQNKTPFNEKINYKNYE